MGKETLGKQASRAALSLGAELNAQLQSLSTPNGRIFAGYAALYLSGWALGVAGVVALRGHPPAQLLLSALLGSQLHALTVLQHDCGHRSAFGPQRLNLWMGRVLAWFVLMPFTTFTELHRLHHGFLGDERHDPDEWFYGGGPVQLFLRECLFMPRFIWLSLTRIPPGEVRARVVRELAFNLLTHGLLVAALLWAGEIGLLVYAWLLPMLWLACVFSPISRGYEHYPMACLAGNDPRRQDLRLNTVSVTSRLMGALWANIGLHVEHHMYPRVPFYRLPALHRLFAGKSYHSAPWPLLGLARLSQKGEQS